MNENNGKIKNIINKIEIFFEVSVIVLFIALALYLPLIASAIFALWVYSLRIPED